MHVVEPYKSGERTQCKVLVSKISSPAQVLAGGDGSIHAALTVEGLGGSVGLYFYRFANLEKRKAFSKIGEVSRADGIIVRKHRGWLSPKTYGDSYLREGKAGALKGIHSDVLDATESDPMFFVFYEFDPSNSFPKLDELQAFSRHRCHFGRSTRNQEATNRFESLGRNLVWHPRAFDEVLAMKLPSGKSYQDAFDEAAPRENARQAGTPFTVEQGST
ncbi:hypothetical protein SAMN05518854_117134 [Variovorax sp. YR266]|uniref:hypothetical protein n=1 Tax=Variovorax sp. YR266 TaxID=1884386 RepID=UPI0008993EF5|nr:hypothetical protein [Variovorax sp. YR266]SDZ71403.1 hypothetical protein SAMN05518854_117134 [Variovorax sp. YR266]